MRAFLIAALAATALAAGCATEDPKDNPGGGGLGSNNITAADFAKVKIGMGKAQVRSILGKPEQTQDQEAAGYKSSCWYYDTITYQVCFNGDKVESKLRN